MLATVRPFEAFYVPRIAQLSQRSNQFNLRTVRYTEHDVERIMRAPRYFGRSFMLEDKVGQYGLISVVVLEKRREYLFIENWLMSCRVLKRGMEEFVLNVCHAGCERRRVRKSGGRLSTYRKERACEGPLREARIHGRERAVGDGTSSYREKKSHIGLSAEPGAVLT